MRYDIYGGNADVSGEPVLGKGSTSGDVRKALGLCMDSTSDGYILSSRVFTADGVEIEVVCESGICVYVDEVPYSDVGSYHEAVSTVFDVLGRDDD